jgi:hypothetical protein
MQMLQMLRKLRMWFGLWVQELQLRVFGQMWMLRDWLQLDIDEDFLVHPYDEKVKTDTFEFSLVLDIPEDDIRNIENALYKAGCSDALLTFRGVTPVLVFDRVANSFQEAVVSALRDVASADLHVTVIEVGNFKDCTAKNSVEKKEATII